MGCFPNTPFLWHTKIKWHVSFETFACAIFGKIAYVAGAINRAGQLNCLLASLPEPDRAGLIDKAESLKSKVQWNNNCFYNKWYRTSNKLRFYFPIVETIVRSIIKYSKLGRSFSSRLFYEPRSRYIANQSGSAKETVSPKIGENIERLVCFICVRTQGRILIDINCHYQITINQHKNWT